MTTARKNVLTMKNGPPFWKTSLSQLIGPLFLPEVVARPHASRQPICRLTLVIHRAGDDPAIDCFELLAAQNGVRLRHVTDVRRRGHRGWSCLSRGDALDHELHVAGVWIARHHD